MLNSRNLIQCELKQSTKYQSEIVIGHIHYALDGHLCVIKYILYTVVLYT